MQRNPGPLGTLAPIDPSAEAARRQALEAERMNERILSTTQYEPGCGFRIEPLGGWIVVRLVKDESQRIIITNATPVYEVLEAPEMVPATFQTDGALAGGMRLELDTKTPHLVPCPVKRGDLVMPKPQTQTGWAYYKGRGIFHVHMSQLFAKIIEGDAEAITIPPPGTNGQADPQEPAHSGD